MTPGFTTRARAERFAAALETERDAVPLGVDPAWLRLVDRLEAGPEVRPRPEFASALRDELLTAARSELVATRPADAGSASDPLERLRLAPGRPRGQRRLTVAVAGLALVGAGGGMAVASQSALPGDTLYPVKRAIEDVRTGLEDDPSTKGSRLIAQARDRLTEVAALTVDDGADPVAVEQTLDDFAAQADEAADLKLEAYYDSGSQGEVLEVRGLAADAVAVLGSLEPVVPETALGSLLRAAREMREIDALARQACGGCGGPVVDLVPELALDPASADLGTALGLRELRAAARPDTRRGAGAGAAGGGADGGSTRDGDRRPAGDDGPRAGQRDRQQDGRDGGVSVPVEGGSVPDVDGLGELTENVRRGLDELAGSTPLGDLTGDLTGDLLGGGTGAGTGGASGSGSGDGSGKDGGTKKADGRNGGRNGGGSGGGPTGGLLGGALEGVDDAVGDLLDP